MIWIPTYVKLTYNSDTYFIFDIILTNMDEGYREHVNVFIISLLLRGFVTTVIYSIYNNFTPSLFKTKLGL